MNDSALDILAGTFKKQETLTDTNTYTFESKITMLDKNIGAGCPVHVFEKATGTLVYTTETDSESFIYVPNLLKNVKYFVVATDKNDTYSSIIFDLNWDFAQQSGNKYNLKYYNKYQASSSKDIYTYTDTVSDLVYDPGLLYSISVPLQKEDQKATWFATGIFNVENIDGFPSFSFKGSASTYTYINFTPVQTGDSFTVECYIRPLALFSGKTVAGGVFSQNISQGLFISDDFRLSYKNKNLTINTISTLEEDTWYHVAVSYDSKRIRLFLNGKKEAETEDSVGLEYLSTVFCVGAGFYGYLSGFKIFQESKYEEDFTPSFRPFGHLPVIYSNEEDPYANNTVLKSYISDSGYLKDKAKNTPLSFDYTIPKDSYIISNNSFIRTPTQYTDLALNGDFTIELKFRLLYRAGTNPVICGNKANKADWATNNWHIHADHPNQLEKYGISIYGGNYNNSLANYPTIYNEPVSLVLQRKGTTYSYYFNGFADRSFTYATAMDTRASSYFSIGGDTSFELYAIKVTKGVARYSENYKDEQLQGSENLLKAYYQIVNYPFKESLYDARNALAFVNTGVLLTSDRSSYKTKSAFFANSYFVTSKSYWYTPNESFTVEFKISCSTLPLTTDDIINTATLFSIFTATSDNFKLAIRDKYLSFYNGIEWLDSEFELDDEDTFKHIVLQRNSTSIKILAEGSLVLETTCPDLAGRRNISIGANKAGSDTFNGYMNNLFIYKNYCKYEDNYQVPEDPDEYVPIEEEKEPDVLITPYTTSALNFEKGLIDQIGTTVWQKEGTANVTSTNKIFGDNSFETKALGDSLYTNSNVITGDATPYSIEFYSLVKGSSKNASGYPEFTYPLISKNNNSGGGEQTFSITNTMNPIIFRNSYFAPFSNASGNYKINLNEINKHQITYDGSAIRWFINDNLELTVGTLKGFRMDANTPFTFYNHTIPAYPQYNTQTIGIIDNINIFDGEARVVRNPDPYEEYLVVDLPFDGENNSTKIVDNGTLKSNWSVNGNAKISTNQKFDGFSSLYLENNSSVTLNSNKIKFEMYEDFTISFEIIRIDNPNQYTIIFGPKDSNNGNVFILNLHGYNYPNSSYSFLKNKISFADESPSKNIKIIYSNTEIKYDAITKFALVRKDGIMYMYVNDKLDASSTEFINIDIDLGNIKFGDNYGMANTSFKGYIKNFKIYKGVAVIPEEPTGKIQLDFDNNVNDKYGNSTWTNNGVTFDQVNSVKGSAAYFDSITTDYLETSSESLNFNKGNFKIDFSFKNLNSSGELFSNNISPNSVGSIWYPINPPNSAFGYLDFYGRPSNTTYNDRVIIGNAWYDNSIVKKNNILIEYRNDVIAYVMNGVSDITFNFIGGGMCRIGKPTSTFGAYNGFGGYLDNFKSIKDYQELVIIDKPAVHLPLETNATNIGFSQLTINSVGAPTYHVVDGKKCIKFEQNKYLTINSNNIFNLGTNSDFYIEFDAYIQSSQKTRFNTLISNGYASGYNSNISALVISRESDGNNLYIDYGWYRDTSNKFIFDAWNNIKLYRQGNRLYLSLNDKPFLVNAEKSFNFSDTTFNIGRSALDSSAYMNGYMSNFKMFVGTSEIPETYNDKKVLDLDFKPTGKSYLFKDNNNKCVIHPVNITLRDYQDSQYCCTFNGTNQYIQLGKNDLLNFGLDDFIIEIDFETYLIDGNNRLLFNNASTNNNYRAYLAICGTSNSNPKKLEFGITNSSGTYYTFRSDEQLEINTRYKVVIKSENGLISMIINSVIQSMTLLNTSSVDFNYNSNTFIGTDHTGAIVNFNGTIYSIKILRNTNDLSLLEDY